MKLVKFKVDENINCITPCPFNLVDRDAKKIFAGSNCCNICIFRVFYIGKLNLVVCNYKKQKCNKCFFFNDSDGDGDCRCPITKEVVRADYTCCHYFRKSKKKV